MIHPRTTGNTQNVSCIFLLAGRQFKLVGLRTKFLLLFLTCGPPAFSVTPECLVRFATLPEDGIDYSLIDSTYDQLLDKLGARLNETTLGKLADLNTNPLRLPEQDGADLLALKHGLEEFAKLLKTKGWNRPEVLTRLRQRAVARAQRLRETEGTRQRLVERNTFEFDVPLGKSGNEFVLSPDGKWIVGDDRPRPIVDRDPWNLLVMNTETDEVKRYPAAGRVRYLVFSPDGARLLFLDFPNKIGVVPFSAGVPDFARTESVKNDGVGEVVPTANPNIAYAAGSGQGLNRIDLAAKTSKPIDWSQVVDPGETVFGNGWGVIPGTANLYLNVWMPSRETRHEIISVNEAGVATRVRKNGPWMGGGNAPNPLRWHSDGRMEFYFVGSFLMRHDGVQPLVLVNAQDVIPGNFSHIDARGCSLSPDGRQAILAVVDQQGLTVRVVWDLVANKKLAPLSADALSPQLAPDGKRAYGLIPGSGDARLRIFNLEARREAQR